MKRIFGVKAGEKWVAFDELGTIVQVAESPHMLETKGCERRGTRDLMRYGWKPAARTDEIDVAQRGVALALASGLRAAVSVRILGAIADALARLRRARPWENRRFPLDVSAYTTTHDEERTIDWIVGAPDPATILLRADRVEITFDLEPPLRVTRTRNARLRPFLRNDQLVEVEAVLDAALQIAEGAAEGIVGSCSAFAGDFTNASAVCSPLGSHRAGGML